MNKQGQMNVGAFVMLFIGIVVIVGAFIPQIFNTQNLMTDKQDVADESFNLTALSCFDGDGGVNESLAACNLTVAQAPSGWKVTECPLTSIVVTNATGTALTLDTDYSVFASTGIIQMLNTTDTQTAALGELALVDYTYCADGYNTSSGGRSTAALIGIFSALAILAWVLDKSGVISFTN